MARYAVIIAGGSGTRLWPLSRRARPKPLLPLFNGQSLLQIAAQRMHAIVPAARGYICAAELHRAAIRQVLPDLSDDLILGEPMPRDSVNAIGLAAAVLARRDPDAIFAVLTADHLIQPQDKLVQGMELGYQLLEGDPSRMVTFMIRPTDAATNYGYIEPGEAFAPGSGFEGAVRVRRFVEKPDLAKAQGLLAAGAGWNSGMFIFAAGTFLRALGWYAPQSHEGLMRIAAAWDSPKRQAVLDEVYPTLPKVSVDYAVMELAAKDSRLSVCAVPLDVHWIDVGSWASFGRTLAADDQGNRAAGAKAVHLDSRNVLAVSENAGHTIATIGCQDLIIVHSKDATLVCRADQVNRVKELVNRIDSNLM